MRIFLATISKIFTLCLYTTFAILLLNEGVFSKSVRGVTNNTIKIGAIFDQTGPIAGDIGLPITEALKVYTSYINDNGGVLGRKVTAIVEDDRYSIPAGIAAFKKLLYKDQIFALIGPASVGETKALFSQIEKVKIPTLTGAPAEAVINPLRKYIFMTFNVYDDQIGAIYAYIVNTLKSKKIDITFVYPDAESGKVVLKSANKWANFFNLKIKTEVINLGALEATSQVMNIRRRKPTHIIIHHGSPGTVVLLRGLRKFGLSIPVFGTMVTCTEDTVRMAGKSSKNYTGAHPFASWYDDLKGSERMRKITLKYKPGTEKPYRSKIYTLGWVLAEIFYEALQRTGKNLNVNNFLATLESIKNYDTKGLCGPISFSPKNHKGLSHSKLYKADPKSGKLVPASDWVNPPRKK